MNPDGPQAPKLTEYVVLKQAGALFEKVATLEATNDIKAVEAALAVDGVEPTGEYVAIPVRNFRLRTVTVENNPVTRIA